MDYETIVLAIELIRERKALELDLRGELSRPYGLVASPVCPHTIRRA